MSWQPTAARDSLQARAELLAKTRDFFAQRQVMEVTTPTLSTYPVSDPHLHNLATQVTMPGVFAAKTYYLQTSPEYHMKRLLAAGSGCIYQINQAFRDQENGRYHNPEFTLLEWYRIGFDHHALIDEVEALLQLLLGIDKLVRKTYRECFLEFCQFDPLTIDLNELQQHCITADSTTLTRDDCLQLLFNRYIEPKLQQATAVFDYPASQAALAKSDGELAARFEIYVQGVELANGYHELTDANELKRRMQQEQAQALAQYGVEKVADAHLLAALTHGLPECAGVALGFDRLCMLALGKDTISEVLTFPTPQA